MARSGSRVVLVAALAAAVLAVQVAAEFNQGFELTDLATEASLKALYARWQAAHKKVPSEKPEENDLRFQVFAQNARKIHAHNARNDVTFRMALNAFADLSPAEFKARHYGLDTSLGRPKRKGNAPLRFFHDDVEAPKSIDWRKLGAVTPVKDQGFCGSCWAFSTTGAIEGINKIVTGDLVSVSEQELVDCDVERDHGCMGGLMDFAFQFVIDNGGIDTESDYGYNATDQLCALKKRDTHAVTIDDYEDLPENSEKALMKAVAAQPVSVAIEADEQVFQFYADGVITGECGTDLDHGVLAVGYGKAKGIPYWIVKNSWGPGWGEGGYVRLQRNVKEPEGKCGIAMMASYPIKYGDDKYDVVTSS